MDINAIFDAFGRASDIIGVEDEARRKRVQIAGVTSRRCGNCSHWMKTTCAPEKVHKQFKSCESIACSAFDQSWSAKRLESEFRVQLDEINVRRSALRR